MILNTFFKIAKEDMEYAKSSIFFMNNVQDLVIKNEAMMPDFKFRKVRFWDQTDDDFMMLRITVQLQFKQRDQSMN